MDLPLFPLSLNYSTNIFRSLKVKKLFKKKQVLTFDQKLQMYTAKYFKNIIN